ncbi:MAG TPA: replicative DNA helicase [Natronosporangium sp.]
MEPQFDRTPPQDIAAEQSVLGGMLLSKDAIADVVEILRASDFYRPAHAIIFDAILDLYGRGEPADPVTVTAALTDAGLINRVGGTSYLHDLVHMVPTAANTAYYARIVADRALLRRLVEAGTRIVQLGYGAAAGGGRDAADVLDLAQQIVYDVAERRVSEDLQPLAEMLQSTLDEIEAIGSRGPEMVGVPTGFRDLDALLHGLHPGQLIVVAGRPGLGKSAVGLDFARNAAVRHGLTSAIFSLEMSKVEIVMRLLAAETRVPLQNLRSGQLSDEDWSRLARRLGEISEAPLFIDDTPNLTLMEIRAKARRLRQRHDLRLLIVDYLQLMTSPRRVESRQQEVSELSRGLKLLAKEIECPVVAIAQLNRGPEQRTDKRPQLSDLRECLTGDTLVARADTGAWTPIRDLAGQRDVPVWTVDERLRLRPGVMTDVWSTGVKPVYRLTLASGRQVIATGNHPFLTVHGWKPLDTLTVGDHIAAARTIPNPRSPARWPEHEIIMLAHLLGDGCTSREPVYYCSRDEANLRAVERAAAGFGVDTRRSPGRGVVYLHFPMRGRPTHGVRNPLYDWLRDKGLYGKAAPHKRVPDELHGLDKEQVALFLRHLWATDGSVTLSRGGRPRIYYATTSRGLAEDVQALLLRLGIGGRLRLTTSNGHRQRWTVDVSGHDDMLTFVTQVGVHGERGARCAEVRAALSGVTGNPNVDTIPAEAWDYARKAMREHGLTTRELQRRLGMSYCGSALYKRGLSRHRMARVAAVLPDPYLRDLAEADVRWDRITSIEPAGEAEVFDAHVSGTHSFLANGLVSHNSGAIEQDSDVVILLHREDYYDKESPRAGEADFIVAKHRNGPTDTITVAAQLQYSRFVDMAVV